VFDEERGGREGGDEQFGMPVVGDRRKGGFPDFFFV